MTARETEMLDPKALEAACDAYRNELRELRLDQLLTSEMVELVVRAYLASRGQAEGWQKIETAPKDGTPILAWCPTHFQGKGSAAVMLWLGDHWAHLGSFRDQPTHWRPLRPAPEPGNE